MTDLGTLPGDNWSDTVAVNDSGQVIGYSFDSGSGRPAHAFPWRNAVVIDLGTGIPTAVNNRGQIVGSREVSGATHGFIWDNGVITTLGTISLATGINSRGQVVGTSYTSTYPQEHGHAWVGQRAHRHQQPGPSCRYQSRHEPLVPRGHVDEVTG